MKKVILVIIAIFFSFNYSYAENVRIVFYERPPYHYGDGQGFACDVLKYVLKGDTLEFTRADRSFQVLTNVENNSYDIGLLVMQAEASFVNVRTVQPALFAQTSVIWCGNFLMKPPVRKFTDLSNMPGLKTYAWIQSEENYDWTSNYRLKHKTTAQAAFLKAQIQDVDFTYYDYYDGVHIILKHNYNHVQAMDAVVSSDPLFYVASPKINPDLYNKIESGLKKLKTDPKLDMISEDSFKLYQTKMAKKEL